MQVVTPRGSSLPVCMAVAQAIWKQTHSKKREVVELSALLAYMLMEPGREGHTLKTFHIQGRAAGFRETERRSRGDVV